MSFEPDLYLCACSGGVTAVWRLGVCSTGVGVGVHILKTHIKATGITHAGCKDCDCSAWLLVFVFCMFPTVDSEHFFLIFNGYEQNQASEVLFFLFIYSNDLMKGILRFYQKVFNHLIFLLT